MYGKWGQVYENGVTHFGLQDVEQFIREKGKKKILVTLVALEGDELLGTVSVKIHDMDTRLDLTPWLAGLYVSESRRRRGIGSTLVNAIERKAKGISIRKLYLYTLRSEGFYTRLGWRVKERTEYHGYLVAIMEKEMIF